MAPRLREITDAMGSRLRVTLDARMSRPVVILERPDARDGPRAVLGSYGAEVLSAFIVAARLALPGDLPDEIAGGTHAIRLRLVREPCVALTISQAEEARPLTIPSTFWDRLNAELSLILAHAREMERVSRVPFGASFERDGS